VTDLSNDYEWRLDFEIVKHGEMWRYSDADPRTHAGTTQTIPNSQIPDEHWTPLTTPAGTLDQFHQLCRWAAKDREFVRKPMLYCRPIQPEAWVNVTTQYMPGDLLPEGVCRIGTVRDVRPDGTVLRSEPFATDQASPVFVGLDQPVGQWRREVRYGPDEDWQTLFEVPERRDA
jgi:hypothetical protein